MESTKIVFKGRAYGEVRLFTDEVKARKMDIQFRRHPAQYEEVWEKNWHQ